MNDNDGGATANFGFRAIRKEEKLPLVLEVFDDVASRYDLMNDLMSAGIHRLWKRAMVRWLRPRPSMTLLDVGGGTGDIAFRFLEKGGGRAVVCDINEEMLAVGRERAASRAIENVSWLIGDAEALPFPDGSFDAYTIAFCLRNVTHIDRALAEARRVLRPGGRFLCLEFSHISLSLVRRLYDGYSFHILPKLGGAIAGNRDAYQYLVESIRLFPEQGELARMMKDAGFRRVTWRDQSMGISAIHSGWRGL
ncbi:ubiquinone/menaquinone biosynthesis C-methyltransferase UbiE [Alphaproteobacteria bacterium]|nr:ubiquinone/menaquinone biosynthesis C-methyltransferase UbiE [Alphaproteobacteria bacterium]